MEFFNLVGTSKTPTIHFDLSNGTLDIKGRSIMENPTTFYEPLLIALDKYLLAAKPSTRVNVHFEYYNTRSSRFIFNVFKKLGDIHQKGKIVSINWIYDEDDMLVDGQIYQSLINIPFNMVKIAE
jgi:hypothetical protein